MNDSTVIDYYGVLGVPSIATVGEIHNAYWKQAFHRHPDKGGSHEEMILLAEAWKILSDPATRARYDQLIKYRHDGWRSRQFNEDVREARKRAKDDAARSWAEFEAIYQKAFYTFNQDFYGDDIDRKAAGPYSPLMRSKKMGPRSEPASKTGFSDITPYHSRGMRLVHVFSVMILLAVLAGAFLFHRTYSGIGRFIPLGRQDAASLHILDTSSGAVYSVEKKDGTHFSTWKETVPPAPREKK